MVVVVVVVVVVEALWDLLNILKMQLYSSKLYKCAFILLILSVVSSSLYSPNPAAVRALIYVCINMSLSLITKYKDELTRILIDPLKTP